MTPKENNSAENSNKDIFNNSNTVSNNGTVSSFQANLGSLRSSSSLEK